jgi:hypothetical protein
MGGGARFVEVLPAAEVGLRAWLIRRSTWVMPTRATSRAASLALKSRSGMVCRPELEEQT